MSRGTGGNAIWQPPDPIPPYRETVERVFGTQWRWHARAACRDYPSEWFFAEESSTGNAQFASPTLLRAILVCASCPVRSECLQASFEQYHVSHGLLDGAKEPSTTAALPVAYGCWGGYFRRDRWAAVRQHGDEVSPALETLDAAFPEFVARKIAEYRLAFAAREVVYGPDRDVHQLLGEPPPETEPIRRRGRVKRFHLDGPGPGRGHLGPIGRYAAEHRVSRSTAWRRLKATA